MNENKLLEGIEDLKNLLILHLIKCGASSEEINKILKTNIRATLPVSTIKKYKK
jgi:hypothetical protein